jgi:purine-binding chemotaxis protein CheW
MPLNNEEPIKEQQDTQHGRFLTFVLGNEVYGIEIKFITEIVGIQPITSLPESLDFFKGIINLRGKIIPVIDMRLKFKKNAVVYDGRTCIIVIKTMELTVGLIVDNVAEVMTIYDNDIVPPPDTGGGIKNKYLKGIGKVGSEVKLLLDCEKLFQNEEIQMINEIK